MMTASALMIGSLCIVVLFLGFLEATSLMKIIKQEEPARINTLNIGSNEAHKFLSHSRPKRNLDPKWYHNSPDFQAYYRYYNSIGYTEGLYEIDRIRMQYQQMRHLEHIYGPNASFYQNTLGPRATKCDSAKDKKCKATPQTAISQVSLPSLPRPGPSQADVIHLCNQKDPLCKPHIVYLPTGAVPVLCDPRYHAACKHSIDENPVPITPPPALEKSSPKKFSLPPPFKKSPPPPAPIRSYKGMEYDCDPYWDPDCQIDNPQSPIKEKSAPSPPAEDDEGEDADEEEPDQPAPQHIGVGKKLTPYPYYYQHELFDPYRYPKPAPDSP